MKEITVISSKEINGKWNVTYKHHNKGECACLGIKITRQFDYKPANNDLISAI